jgi:hypothetical protein
MQFSGSSALIDSTLFVVNDESDSSDNESGPIDSDSGFNKNEVEIELALGEIDDAIFDALADNCGSTLADNCGSGAHSELNGNSNVISSFISSPKELILAHHAVINDKEDIVEKNTSASPSFLKEVATRRRKQNTNE